MAKQAKPPVKPATHPFKDSGQSRIADQYLLMEVVNTLSSIAIAEKEKAEHLRLLMLIEESNKPKQDLAHAKLPLGLASTTATFCKIRQQNFSHFYF